MMIKFMNSLAALALGFVLDKCLGDPKVKIYPLDLMKRLASFLEGVVRRAYEETPEAQHMAGIMLEVLMLIICAGSSLAVTVLFYQISPVTGIIAESILCWVSISSTALSKSLASVNESIKSGNLLGVRRHLKKFCGCDTDQLTIADCEKVSIEYAAENLTDWVVAPIFWIFIFGGVGGIVCRCINILDNTVGYKTEDCRYLGRAAAKTDDVIMFLPARIAALLMRINANILKLNVRNASAVYKRDKRKSPSPNSGCTQAVCAGALNIRLGGAEVRKGVQVRRAYIGDAHDAINSSKIFWTMHLIRGSSAYAIVLAIFLKVAVYGITVLL